MSIAVIINPISGGARPHVARDRAALAVRTITACGDVPEVFVTERRGHARALAAAAAARGVRLVIAWGGDGTINEVASTLAFGDVPMAIVPAGSGNGLATELGVSSRPERAISRALRATPRAIDLGELGGRLFVNIGGIGIDAHIAWQFDGANGSRRGFAGYLRIGARALLTYEPAWYTVSTSGGRFDVRAVLIVLANSVQYGNLARIAPGARIDDGALDLVVVEERSRLATICRTPRLFTGSIDRMRGCSIRRIGGAEIHCAQPMLFHVDGEPVQGGTDLAARVHPGALKVCV